MMIRVNGEYLDFDDDIEIESQIKLFEEISTSNGDYSYSFDLSKTSKNLSALGLPFPDTVKSIYKNVRCELIDDSGFKIHTGGLQVNKIIDTIKCTFFGGNNDWFGLLSDPISTLPLYKYDVDLTEANIQASWSKTKGLVFPILDNGTLVTRGYSNFKVEDFSSAFYIKTLFEEIFNPLGIKLKGDLIEDSTFQKLVVCANGGNLDAVNSMSCYVNKTTNQTGIGASPTKVTFEDDSTRPFFDGSKNTFIGSTYTAFAKMRMRVDISTIVNLNSPAFSYKAFVYVNGLLNTSFPDILFSIGSSVEIDLENGDYAEIFVRAVGGGSVDVRPNSTVKFTPLFIYTIFGNSSVPNWTKGELVSNICKIFNVLPSYNSTRKTLTLDLFNKIKEKEPVDVSDQITIDEIDYSEFVSSYAKSNIFSYQESDDEDLQEYNISNFISYGSGELLVNNDFVETSTDVVESDFTSPITYLNSIFNMSMERINFIELEDVEEEDITSVSDSSGTPRFNITNADDTFTVGDLVRIESTSDLYNGDFVIDAVTTNYITVNELVFDATATGTATLIRHKPTSEDNVYIFINVPNVSLSFFSGNSEMTLGVSTTFTTASVVYFNLLANNKPINNIYKQSLSFGSINNPLSYQKSMLDTYWPIFSTILNDPVMLRISAYFNKKTYSELRSFLRPLRIKTNDTNNLYYLNRITGYKSSHEVCEAELIKL